TAPLPPWCRESSLREATALLLAGGQSHRCLPVLSAFGDGTDMSGLQDRRDLGPRDGAAPLVRSEHNGLERSLAEPLRRQSRIAEHRSLSVPRLAEVEFDRAAKQKVEQVDEIRFSQFVAFALHDVRREICGRGHDLVWWEEANVADKDAADLRI